MNRVKLSEFAKQFGIHYVTANKQFNEGLIPGAQKIGHRIYVDLDIYEKSIESFTRKVFVYSQNEEELELLTKFAISRGLAISNKLLDKNESEYSKAIIELFSNLHTPFTLVIYDNNSIAHNMYEYVHAALKSSNCDILTAVQYSEIKNV